MFMPLQKWEKYTWKNLILFIKKHKYFESVYCWIDKLEARIFSLKKLKILSSILCFISKSKRGEKETVKNAAFVSSPDF